MPKRSLPRPWLLFLLLGCDGGEATPPAGTDKGFSPDHCRYEPAPTRPAAPATSPGAVRAGVGEAILDMPVGTPLGGYTARIGLLGGKGPDDRKTAYNRSFAPSAGVQTRPQAKALYLQAGSESVLLIKADVCVSLDRLVYDVEQAIAPDGSLRGHVIVATSHTHSGWATYQQVFHLALGFDQFQESQYQRLLASLVAAGKQAMAAAVPARLGVGVWQGWDDKDEIYSDRRGEDDVLKGPDGKPYGKHKDGRLMVIRVDDMAGQPLGVVFHFPMHGTIGGEDNPLASVDSTGHVELALEEYFDRKVTVMHLQGPAGDASPRGRGGIVGCDSKQMLCADFARMESVGELAAPRIYELWKALQTSDQAEMEVQSRSVPDGRGISVRGGMAYAPYDDTRAVDASQAAIYDQAGQVRSPITQFNVPYGAGLCGSKSSPLPVQGIDGAVGIPYGSCTEIGAAAHFISGVLKQPDQKLPECETTRTTFTALRLSGVPTVRRISVSGGPPVFQQKQEDLLFGTMPGEPLSILAEILRGRFPAGPDRTFVIGYAQGHIGYILEVENWLLGGYEPSINIYGPLEGEWMMERSLELLGLAWTRQREDAEARPDGSRYDRLVFARAQPQPGPRAPAPVAGQVPAAVPKELFVRTHQVPADAQPAATVARVAGRASFVFYGGDPGEDTPRVTLERQAQDGSFQPVLRRSGRPVDNRGKEMLLTYTPIPVTAAPADVQRHVWAVEWQAVGWDRDPGTVGLLGTLGAPTGRYRLSAAGRADGKDYKVASRAFDVVTAGAMAAMASRAGDKITGKAYYPVGPGYRLLRLDGPSDGDVAAMGMITVRVQSKADGTAQEVTVAAALDGSFSVQTTGLDLRSGALVSVRDRDGNSGQVTVP